MQTLQSQVVWYCEQRGAQYQEQEERLSSDGQTSSMSSPSQRKQSGLKWERSRKGAKEFQISRTPVVP